MAEVYMVQSSSQQNKASIIEETDKDVTFRTILQTGDKVNINRKIYPSDEIYNATIGDPRICRMMQMRTWWGEAGHPLSQQIDRQLSLDMSNRSHSILSMERKGNKFYGTVITTRDERGMAMKGDIDQGDILSFSMRGLHKLDKNRDGYWVVSKLRVFTYDWVPFASHEEAHMVPANESASIITREAIDAVLASESASILSEFEDILGEEVTHSEKNGDCLILKGKSGIIGIKATREYTRSILSDIL
jgi:hypothetical protein